jgi:vacuolar-type H+-ATPase subunit H
MRDVIQKIISTENEARLTVEEARAEAERIMSDAQKKGYDLIERARQETLIEAKKIVDASVEEAERKKQSQLAHAAAEIENQIRLDPATRQLAVEGVVRCVCKQP